jgi:hypothetical protein
MGVVYRATDLELERTVALKFIATALSGDDAFRKRFTSESRVAASLDHPNVIPIFRAGEHDGVLFIAMRYVEGEDLRTEIEESGRLQPTRAASIAVQIASALDAAHARGLVHRDVKPANVLLAPGDHVYLTDFGLTKRALADANETRSGELVGTLNYLAPEQIRGESLDSRTDVYALGCVLFHALTGRVPFPLEGNEAKLWAHVSEPPPVASAVCPDVPAAFDALVARAMAKQPVDRFESAGQLGEAALAACAGAKPARSAPDRALIRRALLDPFSLVVGACSFIAGLLLGSPAVALPLALGLYAVAALRAYLDRDVRDKVRGPARAAAPSRRTAELLDKAIDKEARIQATIEDARLPYTEAVGEVDRLIAEMRVTAGRAALLEAELAETPPDEIASRLEAVKREREPQKDRLVAALTEHLQVQHEMMAQLTRFYDQMEQLLVQLDTVRGHLVTASASSVTDNQERVAAEVRDLRADLGGVAEDLAEAYDDRVPSYPHFGTEGV